MPLELRFDSIASSFDRVKVPFGGEEITGSLLAAEAVPRRLHRLESLACVVPAMVLMVEFAFERADLGRAIVWDRGDDRREVVALVDEARARRGVSRC